MSRRQDYDPFETYLNSAFIHQLRTCLTLLKARVPSLSLSMPQQKQQQQSSFSAEVVHMRSIGEQKEEEEEEEQPPREHDLKESNKRRSYERFQSQKALAFQQTLRDHSGADYERMDQSN